MLFIKPVEENGIVDEGVRPLYEIVKDEIIL